MAAQPILVDAADGAVLDGDLDVPKAPWAAVVLTHPHPLYGGNRYSNVTDALFRALPPLGIAVLRFDFRGVGNSTGEHDNGVAERLDVAGALDTLAALVPEHPHVVVGYSFGAEVTLNVIHPAVTAWCAIAPPLSGSTPLAAADHRRKFIAVPEHDQYNPPSRAVTLTSTWMSTEIEVIRSADHFLVGRLLAVTDMVVEFVRTVAG